MGPHLLSAVLHCDLHCKKLIVDVCGCLSWCLEDHFWMSKLTRVEQNWCLSCLLFPFITSHFHHNLVISYYSNVCGGRPERGPWFLTCINIHWTLSCCNRMRKSHKLLSPLRLGRNGEGKNQRARLRGGELKQIAPVTWRAVLVVNATLRFWQQLVCVLWHWCAHNKPRPQWGPKGLWSPPDQSF